jgi:hypothetical protein
MLRQSLVTTEGWLARLTVNGGAGELASDDESDGRLAALRPESERPSAVRPQ